MYHQPLKSLRLPVVVFLSSFLNLALYNNNMEEKPALLMIDSFEPHIQCETVLFSMTAALTLEKTKFSIWRGTVFYDKLSCNVFLRFNN
jgi:hypothetical protein